MNVKNTGIKELHENKLLVENQNAMDGKYF